MIIHERSVILHGATYHSSFPGVSGTRLTGAFVALVARNATAALKALRLEASIEFDEQGTTVDQSPDGCKISSSAQIDGEEDEQDSSLFVQTLFDPASGEGSERTNLEREFAVFEILSLFVYTGFNLASRSYSTLGR